MAIDEIAADSIQDLHVEIRLEDDRRIPLRFGRNREMQEVAELVDHWPGEGYCYFRVRARGGGLYILRHDERLDRWEIHAFESPSASLPGELPPLEAPRASSRSGPEGSR